MRSPKIRQRLSLLPGLAYLLVSLFGLQACTLHANESVTDPKAAGQSQAKQYKAEVQPLISKYCIDCHSADYKEGDVQLDNLNPDMVGGPHAEKWHAALDMINQGYMPPDGSDQPTDEERRLIVNWMTKSIDMAKKYRSATPVAKVRRLTRQQYTNSLADLLHLPINFGRNLPDEAKSKMGFTNSGSSLVTSSLHVEYFESIAREALDKAMVTGESPHVHRYRVTLGTNVGAKGNAAQIGGYQSAAIPRQHILVQVLDEAGNPRQPTTPEETKALKDIETNIGIGMRGSSGDRYRIVDGGLMLMSALPHKEQAPKSWQGPSPNMKMLLRRCFPSEGPFVTRVVASLAEMDNVVTSDELLQLRSDETVAKLVGDTEDLAPTKDAIVLKASDCKNKKELKLEGDVLLPKDLTKPSSAEYTFRIKKDGLYHIDLVHPPASEDAMPSASVHVDRGAQHLRVEPSETESSAVVTPLTHARLKAGNHRLRVGGKFFVGFREVVISPLPEDHPAAKALAAEAESNRQKQGPQTAALRTFVGNRTDDGMDYAEYDQAVVVDNTDPKLFEFRGYLENLPIPIRDEGEKTSLSNIMIVGVWNDHLVKKPGDKGVPIVVQSIEFEGPYYPVWPPQSHTSIFIDSPLRDSDEVGYTRELLQKFITRAFRESVTDEELERYVEFWKLMRPEFDDYQDSLKEVLVAVLCSPRFLYLATPDTQQDQLALAERLAYLLWNAPPDEKLVELANSGKLTGQLGDQAKRMIADARVADFVDAFATDWLRLDRHAGMDVNIRNYPDYTRFVKRDMPLETKHFIRHVLQNNMSLLTFVESDFAMLNQNLAEFYGIEGVVGPEFRPVPVTPDMHRGGLLSQGAFLTGHSDGTQAHPIKRAVWLKEKILGTPPPPPPPNVPELDPETPGFQNLTLKEQLELHRDKASCRDCHLQIDPYGVVFENYDAVGRFQTKAKGRPIDSKSELPDGQVIDGVDQLKAYLVDKQSRQVAKSVVEHLFAYALGRDATFVDEPTIDSIVDKVVADDYKIQTAVLEIIQTPQFLGTVNNTTGKISAN